MAHLPALLGEVGDGGMTCPSKPAVVRSGFEMLCGGYLGTFPMTCALSIYIYISVYHPGNYNKSLT